MRKFLLLLPLLFIACGEKGLPVTTVTLPDGIKIKAEVASTPEATERGLMYRESLDKDRGMLFVFEEEDYHIFWMKNTFIDLDMVFMNKDKVVQCVYINVPASTAFTRAEDVALADCDDTMYVLEVAAGVAADIYYGQRLEF
ncbi:hypothetical protein AAIR98_001755 [Elusimicrobium simillimum]|uniref:DUF192 domain-containing protein n=1 Tax=Elusimicrobium simillimum TaxID=3143438 RepID=UPI003C6FCC1D